MFEFSFFSKVRQEKMLKFWKTRVLCQKMFLPLRETDCEGFCSGSFPF